MSEYIEREKILELLGHPKFQHLMESYHKYGSADDWHDVIDEIEDDIKSIHASDVVPAVHARWECSSALRACGMTRCSNCKIMYEVSSLKEIGEDKFVSYCPNCGAKMDGEDSEQE